MKRKILQAAALVLFGIVGITSTGQAAAAALRALQPRVLTEQDVARESLQFKEDPASRITFLIAQSQNVAQPDQIKDAVFNLAASFGNLQKFGSISNANNRIKLYNTLEGKLLASNLLKPEQVEYLKANVLPGLKKYLDDLFGNWQAPAQAPVAVAVAAPAPAVVAAPVATPASAPVAVAAATAFPEAGISVESEPAILMAAPEAVAAPTPVAIPVAATIPAAQVVATAPSVVSAATQAAQIPGAAPAQASTPVEATSVLGIPQVIPTATQSVTQAATVQVPQQAVPGGFVIPTAQPVVAAAAPIMPVAQQPVTSQVTNTQVIASHGEDLEATLKGLYLQMQEASGKTFAANDQARFGTSLVEAFNDVVTAQSYMFQLLTAAQDTPLLNEAQQQYVTNTMIPNLDQVSAAVPQKTLDQAVVEDPTTKARAEKIAKTKKGKKAAGKKAKKAKKGKKTAAHDTTAVEEKDKSTEKGAEKTAGKKAKKKTKKAKKAAATKEQVATAETPVQESKIGADDQDTQAQPAKAAKKKAKKKKAKKAVAPVQAAEATSEIVE